MTFLVNGDCIKCKYTDCVAVCPVNCFHEGENTLVIDPDECIDCGVCEPECPAGAIFPEDTNEMPAHAVEFWLKVNAEHSQRWPVISKKKEPMPDADSFNPRRNYNGPNKGPEFSSNPAKR